MARVHSGDATRGARRRPRLGVPRRHRAGVRARLPGAQDRRDQPAGAHAVRLPPDPGARAPLGRHERPSAAGCRRARRCASARPTRPTRTGCASCATRPTSSCAWRNDKAPGHRADLRRARRHRPGALRAAGRGEAFAGPRGRYRRSLASLRFCSRSSTFRCASRVARASSIRRTAATCSRSSTARSTAALPANSTPWSPRRCRRASSTTPASPSPATPSTSPSARGAPHVVMMLVGGGLRVALATTHLALVGSSAGDQPRRVLVADPARAATPTCRSASASRGRASWSPASIRTAASPGTSAREDLEIIAPAVAEAQSRGHRRERPAAGRHAVRAGAAERRRLRARHVPRPGPAGAQVRARSAGA